MKVTQGPVYGEERWAGQMVEERWAVQMVDEWSLVVGALQVTGSRQW